MTTILAPATADTSTADQIINVLATYVDEHNGDTGGNHQNTMLLAACLVRLFDTPATEAVELAKNEPFDERVKAAGHARTEILDRARRTRLAVETWMPKPGDHVTHTGTDGTWIITGYEDEDAVWIARPDAPTTPTIGRAANGMTDLGGWQNRPNHELLASVAELRPVIVAEVQA